MNLGPIIMRAARWPLESISGLRSPEFTALVDAWIKEDDVIQLEGRVLADQLYLLIPKMVDSQARSQMLALRRALHRGTEPVEAPAAIEDIFLNHALRRKEHALAKANIEHELALALEREREHLWRFCSDTEVQKAISLSSPSTYREFARTVTLSDWRLTRTLLQFALRAAGRPTPNGLWSGVCMEGSPAKSGIEIEDIPMHAYFEPKLVYFARAFGFACPGAEFPSFYCNAWEALLIAVDLVPDGDKVCWTDTIERLRKLCDDPQINLDSARKCVNAFLSFYGLDAVADHECVLVCDCAAPFHLRISHDVRSQIAAAIQRTWEFDRLGTGETDAEARRSGACQSAFSDDGPDSTSVWEAELAPFWQKSRHYLQSSGKQAPLPPGSALIRLDLNGSVPKIRVGSITPDPALFYGRFDHVFQAGGHNCFVNWYRNELEQVERRHAGIQFADLALPNPSDWNAAARPRFGQRIFHEPEDNSHVIPLVSSAVSLHTSDAATRRAAGVSFLLGRPALLKPIPVLPREREQWRHLPRLELDEETTISAERWIVPNSITSQITESRGLDRFIAWRRYVLERGLPSVLYALTGIDNTELLLFADSVLVIEVLARSLAGKKTELRLQEAFPDPHCSWLTDKQGNHYVAELAVSWRADPEFWSGYLDRVPQAAARREVCQ